METKLYRDTAYLSLWNSLGHRPAASRLQPCPFQRVQGWERWLWCWGWESCRFPTETPQSVTVVPTVNILTLKDKITVHNAANVKEIPSMLLVLLLIWHILFCLAGCNSSLWQLLSGLWVAATLNTSIDDHTGCSMPSSHDQHLPLKASLSSFHLLNANINYNDNTC